MSDQVLMGTTRPSGAGGRKPPSASKPEGRLFQERRGPDKCDVLLSIAVACEGYSDVLSCYGYRWPQLRLDCEKI
jgi:hypothetical protein